LDTYALKVNETLTLDLKDNIGGQSVVFQNLHNIDGHSVVFQNLFLGYVFSTIN